MSHIDTSPAALRKLAGTCEEFGFPNIRKALLAIAAEKEAQQPSPADVPLPGHPEPHTYRWTELELEAIKQHREAYAKAAVAVAAERERCAQLSQQCAAEGSPMLHNLADAIRANQKGAV